MPLDPSAVAKWLVNVAPAYIWLVNDSDKEVEYMETRPNGKQEMNVRLEPKRRTWASTQLGAEWIGMSGNETVSAITKVQQVQQ